MFVPAVYAQCPVCVVTVGGGLFLAKWLGIDDILASIWLSALNTALAFWFASMMKNKILKNGYGWATAFFILTIGTLALTNQIGIVGNTYLGIDKILVGLTVGFVTSIKAIIADKLIRKKNNGKILFRYQKVIIPLIFLVIATLFFVISLEFV